MDIFYQVVTITSGVVLLVMNLIHIAKKKMDVGIGTSWTIMSALIIVFGCGFDFERLVGVSVINIVLTFIFFAALVIALYLYGLRITELKKRVNDISIWVSIIRKDTYKYKGKDGNAQADGASADAAVTDGDRSGDTAEK